MASIERLEDVKINKIKGVGEKTQKLFQKVGISNLDELIHYYPRAYDVYEKCVVFGEVFPGKKYSVKVRIISPPVIKAGGKIAITLLNANDGTGTLQFIWYNMPYLRSVLKIGSTVVLRGMVVWKNGRLCMEQPEFFSLNAYEMIEGTIQPVYSLTTGLKNKLVAKSVKQVFDGYELCDHLPQEIVLKYGLIDSPGALKQIHFPADDKELIQAKKRIIFDEFLLFLLKLEQLKHLGVKDNHYPVTDYEKADDVIKSLPYELTNAQLRILGEIKSDMSSKKVMNRLVQGDVGSGKTIIAFYSMIATMCAGYQSALMAPTEVLAAQHFDSLTALLRKNGIDTSKAALLTGSIKQKEKKLIYERIISGEISFVVGTHAIIQEKTVFDRLALVVTDEQHRFGVVQRDSIIQKGDQPHVLVMSATPIPRTLALILYGDMSVSRIDELPAKRLKIKNCVVDTGYRKTAYSFILKEIQKGHQAYIICPMIEANEDVKWENVTEYTAKIRKIFPPEVKVAMLHGRMSANEKLEVMRAFSENEVQILVSTTVVEVGVNVPNATVMLIENAECFGLAQLHQLRGRIGRGDAQSYCIFMQCDNKQETNERLRILNDSNDGFYIASEDLKLRGQGDLFGFRQSGIPGFVLADPMEHSDILTKASECASKIIEEDPELTQDKHLAVGEILKRNSETVDVVL